MTKLRTLAPPPSLAPHQQAQAAAIIVSLKQRLLAECPDIEEDPKLWLDTLDGQTDTVDTIRHLIRASIDADVLAEATRQRQAEIAARAERAERRKQAFRAAAVTLMDLAGLARLPEPDFNARVQAGQPQLGALDLDALPPEFVDVEVTVTRRPLKDRILAALKAGQTVDGAQLRQGSPFLVINRK
jgi:Siphovirus Gp157